MRYIVSYDITDNRMRNRACRLLKDHGRRVQYSMFECQLHPAELDHVLRKAAPLLNGPNDSLRVYRLCEHCCRRAIGLEPIQGKGHRNAAGEPLRTSKCVEEPPAFIVV